ncbi:hypothetical protein RJ639_046939, partial [Escallonia herrerae]
VLSKLVDGGGVDVGQYGRNCTHVIVDKIVHDDPMCVAARNDGKTLINGLWVGHSFDVGMPVDPTNIMYRPVQDLNGIPGAKSLMVCLTGYQRQDRDDIMTMVGLIGATFTKPLVANKVTHLICYKFEGEKYELAKKMKRIKLVNHRWLEECLKAWKILPEVDYDKSGYELEMMEAEAKDSEDEDTSSKHYGGKAESLHQPLIIKQEVSRSPLLSSACKRLSTVGTCNDVVSTTGMNDKHPDKPLVSKQDVARSPLLSSAFKNLSSNQKGVVSSTISSSNQAPTMDEIRDQHPDPFGSREVGILGISTCGNPSTPYGGTAVPARVDIGSTSTSRRDKRSPQPDAAKLGTLSDSRKTPRRTPSPLYLGKMANNLSSGSTVNIGKLCLGDGLDISASVIEQAKDGTDSKETPSKGNILPDEVEQSGRLSEKRKMEVSYGSSKLQKRTRHPEACTSEGTLVANRTEGSEPAPYINGPVPVYNTPFPSKVANYPNETAALNSAVNSHGKTSSMSPAGGGRKIPSRDTPIFKRVTSEIRQDDNVSEALQTHYMGSKKASLAGEPDARDLQMVGLVNGIGEAGETKMPDTEVPSSGKKALEIEKSNGSVDIVMLEGENAEPQSRPVRRKMFAKKVLGSKRSLGKANITTQKGSIYSDNLASQNNAVTSATEGEVGVNRKKTLDSRMHQKDPSAVNLEMTTREEANDALRSGYEVHNESLFMDDETEAPEDKEEQELKATVSENYVEADLGNSRTSVGEEKSERVQYITSNSNVGISAMHDKDAQHCNEACTDKTDVGESTDVEKVVKGQIPKGKKRPLTKVKKGAVLSIKKITESKVSANEETKSDKCTEKTVRGKEESIFSNSTVKTKKTVPENKLDNSVEVGKENRPVHAGDHNVSHGKKRAGKVASRSKTPRKADPRAGDSDAGVMQLEHVSKTEPVCFILSGHKLQRKEFQQFIRRLKGRVCRDSHQWSYQATHFVVPDPIRRTEKFFAAAASGRWILKTDYLTASSEAGKFLMEEPYEWHRSGLSEDGAINLEAPRKWRLLRQRTGHGAFYGMRILIYGECIAPPLDTLKRVVKAGDGTILATSAPYTRFLESGVDFAIVSPGTPRVDMWVQEFLRHEIPCVLADYLVEYVCRPGYSLERHVQYNTHAWAEKSLKNLGNRLEEIDHDTTRRRFCGSVGCGIGTHFDCCDPPLEDVPEEDWFCQKCSKTKNSKSPRTSTKKGASVSKRRK